MIDRLIPRAHDDGSVSLTLTSDSVTVVAEQIDIAVPDLPSPPDHETFVWVQGMRGPEPQAWSKDYQPKAMTGGDRDRVLVKIALTGVDRVLGLDALAMKYPFHKIPVPLP